MTEVVILTRWVLGPFLSRRMGAAHWRDHSTEELEAFARAIRRGAFPVRWE